MRMFLLAASLLLAAVAAAPTSSADTCTTGDPELDFVVCTPLLVTLCLAGRAADEGSPKDTVEDVRACTTIVH